MDRLRSPEYQARVRELLNELEDLEPRLSRSRREVLLSKFRNTMAVVALLAFLLSGIALIRVGIVDRNISNEAKQSAADSKRVSDCINNILGIRSTTTTRETVARKEYAEEQKAFAKATEVYASTQADIFTKAIAGSKDPNLGKLLVNSQRTFEAASAKFERASNDFVVELSAIETFRQSHPLGKC